MEIGPGVHCIDIGFEGRTDGIAACVLETGAGIIIVDPGPSSCLAGLRGGLEGLGCGVGDIAAILLTHIHLDHAGGTGTLVRENPRIRVFVHDRGAGHMIDPTKLLASARRIYGDSLDGLFGEMVSVPAERVSVLEGGETIAPGGRAMRVEYAPGHARHHVAYLDEQTGTVLVGDTAGERFGSSTFVMPVTPPPDIDLESWRETTSMLRGLGAERVFLTHFGAYEDVGRHLDEHDRRLEAWAEEVRASLDEAGTDDDRADRFEASVAASVTAEVGEEAALPYAHAGLRDSWVGLARYWRRRHGYP